MNFTNAALQSLIGQYGDRISCLMFDNKNAIFIGHPSSPCKSVDDLVFTTVDGVDLVGVPLYPTNSKDRAAGVLFTVYHVTATLHAVTIVDEDHPEYLVDPLVFG
jgi:hypothetical protein